MPRVKRFPRPDFALAIHDSHLLLAGQIGLTPGFAILAVDPVLMAARAVVTLQSIVAREINPLDPA